MLPTITDYFRDSDFVFTAEIGFNVAVGFSSYDQETEWILDRSYGRIVLNAQKWGMNSDGTRYYSRDPIPAHLCSAEELGLAEGRKGAKFSPMQESTKHTVDLY